MKTVLILRSNECFNDSRVMRVAAIYENIGFSPVIIGWDRKSLDKKIRRTSILFSRRSQYGKGYQSILDFIFWFFFLIKTLISKRSSYSIVHACDLDTSLPALFSKIIGKILVVDVFDAFAYSRKVSPTMRSFLMRLESKVLAYSDISIFPDMTRQLQFKKVAKKTLIIENVPLFENGYALDSSAPLRPNKSPSICYVGTLTVERGLPELLETISALPNILLTIAGTGELTELVAKYSAQFSNIKFLGSVEPNAALKLISDSDLNYAAYYLGGRFHTNHFYACPNKFYESLYTGTPILTNKGTNFADRVETLDIGYTIAEGTSALKTFLQETKFFDSSYGRKKLTAQKQWEQQYSTYYERIRIAYSNILAEVESN